MNIWLVRHTTPEVETGVCYGQSNIGVTDTFVQEATMVRNKLPDLSGVTIYTSPLTRCQLLAEYLAQHNTPLIDPCLMEMDFGDWEGQRWIDVDQEQLKRWGDNHAFEAPPNGESMEQLYTRCAKFYDKVISGSLDRDVILVTHGGVIRSILCHALDFSMDKAFSFHLDFASVSTIGVDAHTTKLICLNR